MKILPILKCLTRYSQRYGWLRNRKSFVGLIPWKKVFRLFLCPGRSKELESASHSRLVCITIKTKWVSTKWRRGGRGRGEAGAVLELNGPKCFGLEPGRVLIIEPGPALGIDNLRFRVCLSPCKQHRKVNFKQILSPGLFNASPKLGPGLRARTWARSSSRWFGGGNFPCSVQTWAEYAKRGARKLLFKVVPLA